MAVIVSLGRVVVVVVLSREVGVVVTRCLADVDVPGMVVVARGAAVVVVVIAGVESAAGDERVKAWLKVVSLDRGDVVEVAVAARRGSTRVGVGRVEEID